MTAVLPPPSQDTAHEAPAPHADCVADSAGGLTFDLAVRRARGAAALLLRLRDRDDEIRLPLTPACDGGLRAVLPSTVSLAEGRWDAYIDHRKGAPERLAPGINDLRSLVDRMPSGIRPHIAVRIPYATKHGNLTVRAWHRAPHAEAGELRIEQNALTVRGRVFGTALTQAARVEARLRAHPASVHSRPVSVHLTQVTTEGADFAGTVAYEELAGERGVWDLWLLPAGDGGPRARIARLLDDVADKKAIFTYPVARLASVDGPVEAQPYYTADNDLSIKMRAVEPPAADRPEDASASAGRT